MHLIKIYSFLIISFFLPVVANAEAYCALRDPINAIHKLYPEANKHRSIVKIVDQEARNLIGDQLPFTLHFNELGKHTLYMALKNDKAVGFVHVRSELSSWGLMEIAWALNPDLSVRGLYFQRCRNPACNEKLVDTLTAELKDKSFNEILSYLEKDGTKLVDGDYPWSQRSSKLIIPILRSALKTIAITNIVWNEDVSNVMRYSMLEKHFPQFPNLSLLKTNFSEKTLSKLEAELNYTNTLIKRDSVEIFKVMNDSEEVGRLVESSWQQDNYQGDFIWLYTKNGTIVAIEPRKSWPNQEVASAFNEIIGANLSNSKDCNTAVQLAGYELYFLSYNVGK